MFAGLFEVPITILTSQFGMKLPLRVSVFRRPPARRDRDLKLESFGQFAFQ